jgi:hypothetical protein
VAELLKEAKYTITEFTMNNRKKLSEFAGLEVELPKIELPDPNVDISSDELQHDTHDIDADDEGAMMKADLYKLAKYSVKLFKKIEDEDQFESWVQAKITKAADYISSVYHYLEYEMKFSEYGDKIENSDMYSESQKKQMKNALMEAKKTLAALKIDQADKLDNNKVVKEGVAHTCAECGGTGMVEKPLPERTQKLVKKHRVLRNFVQSKVDANHNGIPDDEEESAPSPMDDEIISSKPKSKKSSPFDKKDDSEKDDSKSKKSAPKKDSNPFAKKEKSSDSDSDTPKKSAPKKEKSEKDDSKTESMFGGSVYGESVTPVKKPSGVADKKGGNPFAKKEDAKKEGGKEFGKALSKAKDEWNTVKESAKEKAKKDYDKDGETETSAEEHRGVVDKAIKSAKDKECMNESVELTRLREITSRVIR